MTTKHPTFHISVDDVLPSLVDISINERKLTDNTFFKTLKLAWELYGIRTGLHLFYQYTEKNLKYSLSDVRSLSEEINNDWICFGPHALDNETPPYAQSVLEQVITFNKITSEIDRIASKNKSKSIRLHHYSECYENAEYFIANGIGEIFTTDKPVGLHRFGPVEQKSILEKGSIVKNGLKLSRTHLRIEDLANKNVNKSEFIDMAQACIGANNRLVIYSHEYEHKRDDVNKMFLNVSKWLTEDLQLQCEQP